MAYATKEKEQAYQRAYRAKHRERLIARMKERYRRDREERLAKQRAYYAANRERALTRNRIYAAQHREQAALYKKQYNLLHMEHIKVRNKAYQAANREINRNKHMRRRVRKIHNGRNDFSTAQWKELKALWGYRCAYCGKKTIILTQDHVTPISQGGEHTASNIVPACGPCNSTKHTGKPLVPIQPVLLTLADAKPYLPRRT